MWLKIRGESFPDTHSTFNDCGARKGSGRMGRGKKEIRKKNRKWKAGKLDVLLMQIQTQKPMMNDVDSTRGSELDFYGTTRVEERRGADGRGEACKVKEYNGGRLWDRKERGANDLVADSRTPEPPVREKSSSSSSGQFSGGSI